MSSVTSQHDYSAGCPIKSLFVGIGISITAIAVQSVILHSMKISATHLGHIIIGAAIADDILSLIGFGMNGRGAMEIVVATVVLNLSGDLMASNVISVSLLTQDQFSALILMAFITTLIAPITLKWSVMKACSTEEKASFCLLWNKSRQR